MQHELSQGKIYSSWLDANTGLVRQVHELESRLQAVLRGVPVLGGVLCGDGWGARSLRGALFLGEKTLDSGAVGCLLRGPMQVVLFAMPAPPPPPPPSPGVSGGTHAASRSSACVQSIRSRCGHRAQTVSRMRRELPAAATQS